jgi:hypothetical protein
VRKAGQNDLCHGLVVRGAKQTGREISERHEILSVLLVSVATYAVDERKQLRQGRADELPIRASQRGQMGPPCAAMLELVRQVALVQFSEVCISNDAADVLQREATDRLRETRQRDPQQAVLPIGGAAPCEPLFAPWRYVSTGVTEVFRPVRAPERVTVFVFDGPLGELDDGPWRTFRAEIVQHVTPPHP